MAIKTKSARMPDSYFELVNQLPLVHIRDEWGMDEAQEMIDLLLQKRLDRGEQAYLDVLTDLVEAYEDEHEPIEEASEAEVLRELMRVNGLSQQALAKKVGISQSTVSAVLTGNRTLTRDQVVALAKYFNVSPAAFLSS